ncbi:hypothetical protein T310_4862 [Rasamsonia emersonii CBS 393.64]|uniref:Uncharacterized protein n=1 Tax=Rasamsonia emersonii (strain ATCC 16479 / CBS 393.64 / IMI 116815) TaxID=1408163 RepID=A0A0F4YTE7_RASE3|nr:hypothetical protein T310_4862 [Rasamsonia emersonii CBS 393.64]KKA21116.1 hypothetical protein T310_4862 [Rasamsonia emersonii CBS 393.64]
MLSAYTLAAGMPCLPSQPLLDQPFSSILIQYIPAEAIVVRMDGIPSFPVSAVAAQQASASSMIPIGSKKKESQELSPGVSAFEAPVSAWTTLESTVLQTYSVLIERPGLGSEDASRGSPGDYGVENRFATATRHQLPGSYGVHDGS